MNFTRTDGGPVGIEFDNGTIEYITNPVNVLVKGKSKPAKNADFEATEEVRVFQFGIMLYSCLLGDLEINGVPAAGTLQQSVTTLAELFNNTPIAP